MPQKLNFTKTNLLSFTRVVSGGSAKFSASPSKAVCKALEWTDFPEGYKTAQPNGGPLKASSVELTPSERDLEKHAVALGVCAVRDFHFVRTQIKKGKAANQVPTFKTELRFTVDFSDANGARQLEQYFQCGASSGTLRVTYERQPEQEQLITEDQAQATLEEND
jgi:hypothetical protein